MGYRNQVIFEIRGTTEQLDSLRKMAPKLFERNEVNILDDTTTELVQLSMMGGGVDWALRWFNGWIKWDLDQLNYEYATYDNFDHPELHSEHIETQEFLALWYQASQWGLSGKIVRIGKKLGDIEEYSIGEDNITTIGYQSTVYTNF